MPFSTIFQLPTGRFFLVEEIGTKRNSQTLHMCLRNISNPVSVACIFFLLSWMVAYVTNFVVYLFYMVANFCYHIGVQACHCH